jgi:hypothetical protein
LSSLASLADSGQPALRDWSRCCRGARGCDDELDPGVRGEEAHRSGLATTRCSTVERTPVVKRRQGRCAGLQVEEGLWESRNRAA